MISRRWASLKIRLMALNMPARWIDPAMPPPFPPLRPPLVLDTVGMSEAELLTLLVQLAATELATIALVAADDRHTAVLTSLCSSIIMSIADSTADIHWRRVVRLSRWQPQRDLSAPMATIGLPPLPTIAVPDTLRILAACTAPTWQAVALQCSMHRTTLYRRKLDLCRAVGIPLPLSALPNAFRAAILSALVGTTR